MFFQSATVFVRTVVTLIKELTIPRLGISMLAIFLGIAMFAMWEQRQAVFVTVTGSVFAMFTIGFGVSMVLTTLSSWSFHMAERKRNEEQVNELKRSNELQAQDFKKEIDRLHTVIKTAVDDERRQCDEKMELQRKHLEDLIERRHARRGN